MKFTWRWKDESNIWIKLTLLFILFVILTAQTVNLRVRNLNNVQYANMFNGSDSGAQIQACINAAVSNGNGNCDASGFTGTSNVITSTITITTKVALKFPSNVTFTCSANPCFNVQAGGTQLYGAGQGNTKFIYNPSGAGTFMLWQAPSSIPIVGGKINGFVIDATGNNQIKKGIKTVDASELEISDIQISNWHDSGNLSEGIEIQGRQDYLNQRWTIVADIPVKIMIDPNTNIVAADHYTFRDIYTIAACGNSSAWSASCPNPNWLIDNGVFLTNDTWDGYQSWVLGANGLTWNDTTSVSPSYNVSFNNVRWEQDANMNNSGEALHLSPHNSQFSWALNIYNTITDSHHNGYYIRNFHSGTFSGNFYDGLSVALNADSSVQLGILNNFFNLTAGATLSVTGFAPTMYCGNDFNGAGQASSRCGLGVADPLNQITIPNNTFIAGRNNSNTGDIPIAKVDSSFSHVDLCPGGGQCFTGSALGIFYDGAIGSNTILAIPNGLNHCLGGQNVTNTDSYRIACIDTNNNIAIAPQDASNHAYTISPSWSFGGDRLSGNTLFHGSGNPNGVVTGIKGDLYVNTNGGAGTTLYVNEAGGTVWVGK